MFKSIKGCSRKLSDQEINTFEAATKLSLPEEYKKFLLKTNGGVPSEGVFPIIGMNGNPVGTIQAFLGLHTDIESEDILWVLDVVSESLPHGLLPVACTGCGDYVCIDTRIEHCPVVFWDHHASWGDREREPVVLYPIASNFEEFLRSLTNVP